jgi:hypothetical protein
MFNKTTTVAIIILVLVMIGLIITSFTSTLPENEGTNPISFPVEETKVTEFVDEILVADYAYIKNGNIYISYTDGSNMPVKLENKSWRNVRISPNGKSLAVIGKEDNGSDDIFVYNIDKQEFNRMTFFQNETNGVTDLYWVDNRVVAFHQDEWLHSLNTTSKEVVKMQSGMAALTGVAGNTVGLNTTQNVGAIFDFEDGNLITQINQKIVSTSSFDDDISILLSDGIYSLDGPELVKVSDLTGSLICGELIWNAGTVTNYADVEVVMTELPSSNIKCVKDALYFESSNRWYTLDSKEIKVLENVIYFDKF